MTDRKTFAFAAVFAFTCLFIGAAVATDPNDRPSMTLWNNADGPGIQYDDEDGEWSLYDEALDQWQEEETETIGFDYEAWDGDPPGTPDTIITGPSTGNTGYVWYKYVEYDEEGNPTVVWFTDYETVKLY